MDVIETIDTAERVVSTLSQISMHNWTRRNLVTLVIATAAFATVAVAIHIIKDKQKGSDTIDNQTI